MAEFITARNTGTIFSAVMPRRLPVALALMSGLLSAAEPSPQTIRTPPSPSGLRRGASATACC